MASSSTIWDVLPKQLSRPCLQEHPIEKDSFWSRYERKGIGKSIHVAILAKNYLELILNKNKTIESRFSMHRRMPYNKIQKGDIILFKQTSGMIKGLGFVSDVKFFEFPEDTTLDIIKSQYCEELQIQDNGYWDKYSASSYGTLIQLDHVRRIKPMKFSKRDRNAWVIFNPKIDS